MTQQEKSALWDELKAAGVSFDKHYRDYTTAELRVAVKALRKALARTSEAEQAEQPVQAEQPTQPEEAFVVIDGRRYSLEEYEAMRRSPRDPQLAAPTALPLPPVAPAATVAGTQTQRTVELEPIRTDENGLIWYQDEVRKPPFAKPRGRRRIQYNDPGVKTETTQIGDYTETFEMPGDEQRIAEARVTLPSYQVGIYRDPRLPFKIHIYNEERGFDFFEVHEFYGSADLVPEGIKRKYVSSTLCYDIQTTIREIQREARELQLKKGSI